MTCEEMDGVGEETKKNRLGIVRSKRDMRKRGSEGCTVAVTHSRVLNVSNQFNAVQCSAVPCNVIHINIEISCDEKIDSMYASITSTNFCF